MGLPVLPTKPVKVVIPIPPALTGLVQVKVYAPPTTATPSTIYTTTPIAEKSPAFVAVSEKAVGVTLAAPSQFCYVRNNRIVGYFSSQLEAQNALDWHIARENELGADI